MSCEYTTNTLINVWQGLVEELEKQKEKRRNSWNNLLVKI